jgi:signal transduction histidine kinase
MEIQTMISLTSEGDICHGVKLAIDDASHMIDLGPLIYNVAVKNRTSFVDAVRLVRFAAVLWIGYLVFLAIISRSFPVSQRVNPLFYVALGSVAVLCLILSYWNWIQERLRKGFIPLVVAIITILPVVLSNTISRLRPIVPGPLGPQFATAESLVLVIFPFVFVALMLVAWRYKWQYVLLVILGIAGLDIGMVWSFTEPGSPPFMGGLTVALIQTVIFLAVGFSISYLMSRLNEQQQSLAEANTRLQHHASTLEHLATSRERNRVARELHDTLAHTLSGLSVQLEAVKAYWDIDAQKARSTLESSLQAAHSGLGETRRALQALRASPLDDLGLSLAVRRIVEDAAARANLALDLSIVDKLPPLSPDVEQCIYRVAQEAVANVIRHAKAKTLTVNLDSTGEKVTLTVQDDGIGFDLGKKEKTNNYGLEGMQERAQLAGGELTLISKPREGTTVKLVV